MIERPGAIAAAETRSRASVRSGEWRVADGIRTRDHRDHNPGLYQLSYRHREQRTE